MIDINKQIHHVSLHPPNTNHSSSGTNKSTNSKYYFYIYDCILDKIISSDVAFENATGHCSDDLQWPVFKKLIHEDDKQRVVLFRKKAIQFSKKFLYSELFKFVISFNYRLRRSNKEYISVTEKRQVIEITSEGKLSKILIQHQVMPSTCKSYKQEFKILDLSTNKYIEDLDSFHLTKREIEIIGYIQQGNNSTQIADKLSVSKNTIITHRRNILAKTKCKTFVELIQKFNTASSIK